MSTTTTHQTDTQSDAGGAPAAPATLKQAGEGLYTVVVTTKGHGRLEEAYLSEPEAVAAFEGWQRGACFGPHDQFGDIAQVELRHPNGTVVRQSPRWN